ncbi:MAG: hypothetical protein MN733_23435, partial [Nitrososphaera sp.]|nr:hypothetical protein [Nitrososphaera sp.]
MPLEQTHLFQLNLMIFLGRPSASMFVTPILYNEGFVLYLISPPTPTSLQNQARAADAIPPIPFTPSPSPDLVFVQNEKMMFVPLECKVSSFGPDAEQARQAAALLSCTGSHLADTFGRPSPDKWTA